MNKGKIVQIIGPVVDIEFSETPPPLYNAVSVEFEVPGAGKSKLTLEVQQHLGTIGSAPWPCLPPKV
jgi:F-type H+-transporting ATPase subunit beta